MRELLSECIRLYLDIAEKDFSSGLTEGLYGLIMDIKKKLDPCYYVCKTGYVIKYDPGQPRDDRGRWTDGGGSSGGSGETVFHSLADPMVEVTGPAEKSNPKEVEAYKKELQDLGIELIRRKEETLAYSPSLRAGQPGRAYISEGASYSAWSHEIQHVRDDYADGWTGMRILENPEKRYQREVRAYNVEIKLAEKANRSDIVNRLKDNLEQERRDIYGE